jgi:protein-tyrosine phosphatase
VAWVNLDGAVNVRDLGALPAGDGQRTAPRRLLRGDDLQDLSPADVRLLVEDIGVTTVIDLRSAAEVASEGPGPLTLVGSIDHAYLPILPDSYRATDTFAMQRNGTRPSVAADMRVGHYLGYLEDRPDHVVTALQTIAHAPGAALVHCAIGKDRTGVVVAMALSAVGVRRDAVVDDYEATAERMHEVLGRLRASKTYAADVDKTTFDDHLPRAQTMEAFLDQVSSRHGGVLPWLLRHGFGASDVALLRTKLLDPPHLR